MNITKTCKSFTHRAQARTKMSLSRSLPAENNTSRFIRYRDRVPHRSQHEDAFLAGHEGPAVAPSNGVTIYPNWDQFRERLNGVERDKSDTDDIRIVTMAFTRDEKPADKFVELVSRNLHIKVILTNPIPANGSFASEIAIGTGTTGKPRSTPSTPFAIRLPICGVAVRRSRICERTKAIPAASIFIYRISHALRFAALTPRLHHPRAFLATGWYGADPMIVVETATNPRARRSPSQETGTKGLPMLSGSTRHRVFNCATRATASSRTRTS